MTERVFSEDQPRQKPEEDLLGYAPFAKRIAEALRTAHSGPGWVMAINGEWGTGKTTVRNFVEYYLKQENTANGPLLLRFNPWMYSGLAELTLTFLHTLLDFLREHKVVTDAGRQYIEKLGAVLNRVPLSIASTGAVGLTVDPTKILGGEDADKLKDRISKALEEQPRRIVVFIDDIDRLSVDEIRSLFRAIKAVADFPNVIYILFFDLQIVAKALESIQADIGTSYLEKIVQVSFDLPPPDRASLHRLFTKRLDAILEGAGYLAFDSTYWGNIFLEGIEPFLDSPRKIVCLLNLISLTYPSVAKEVNAVDYIAICTLQVFAPDVYRFVRREQEIFTRPSDDWGQRPRREQEKERLEEVLAPLGQEAAAVRGLLKRIFPEIESLYRSIGFGSEWQSRWYRDRRVCSPDVFPVFFRFAPPDTELTNAELRSLLGSMASPEVFAERLSELGKKRLPDGTVLARHALESLWHFATEEEDIPAGVIPGAIRGLFLAADHLVELEPERPGMFELDMSIVIGRLFYRLMRRIRGQQLDQLLEQIAKDTPSVGFLVREIAVFGQSHGKYGGDKDPVDPDRQLIDRDVLARLEQVGVARIRAFAADAEKFLSHTEVFAFLWRWSDWGTPDEPKSFVEAALASDEQAVRFIRAARGKAYLHSMGDLVTRHEIRFALETVERFGGLSKVLDRAREIESRTTVSAEDRQLLEQFISAAEKEQAKPAKPAASRADEIDDGDEFEDGQGRNEKGDETDDDGTS